MRLRKDDFATLLSPTGVIEHKLEMPNKQNLTYQLRTNTDEEMIAPSFINGTLDLVVPKQALEKLLHTQDQEGVYYQFDTSGTPLKVAIEKDFPCEHSHVDESDDYTTCFDRL